MPIEPTAAQIPDHYPPGTTAKRCTGCGETRYRVPGDLTDEWKKHDDYCEDSGGDDLDRDQIREAR